MSPCSHVWIDPTEPIAEQRRNYPLPENYPVDSSLIPDMPIESFHLETTGRITPADRAAYGFSRPTCGTCGDRETTLLLMRPPTAPEDFRKRRPKGESTGLVWGVDVVVVCPCCSFDDCQHCMWAGELVHGHKMTAAGVCSRCGKRAAREAATA